LDVEKPKVEEAGQVFLLMKKEYRISRNVRLAWFLSKLNQYIRPTPQSELITSDNELDILSILPKGWQSDETVGIHTYQLVPSSYITFLARRYRFVIELDLSPSTGIVDDSTGELIFDEVFHALSRCLMELSRPFKIPGTDVMFQPEIFITILAYSSIIGLQTHQVLVQGCLLDQINLETFLQNIYLQLRAFENNVAEVLQSVLSQGDANDVYYEQPSRKMTFSMVTSDMGLVNMIRNGILALQLLPSNSSAGIIIITDGVTSVPDVAVCETLLNQLRCGTIACSFIQVGGVYSYDCSFGYVPNLELMKFIAMATFGSYMSTYPEITEGCLSMNAYHKAFLLYSFLRPGEPMNPEYYCASQHKVFNEHLVSASSNPALAMRRKKHTEKEVHADLISVVSVRLREGYTVKEVNFTKGGAQLEVKLMLLWKHNMRIEYLVVASWPLDPGKRMTWVEVTMEGSYDMLHDISCTMRKPITSPYRTTVIRRFWNTLQSINQTDQMLVHLKSFNTIPEHYTIPESTKNGVPLFYIPPGSTTPVLSLQHSGSKDSSQSQFSSYWKPVLSMDASFWQRWLHMHRIGILLEHDIPLPKHIHTTGSNGRYSTIQCRISLSALTSLLRDWSSFVLVEGYSYVKLLYNGLDQPPSSFYLVRIISKAPCMVLRLGFPIGTQAQARNKIVDGLRDQILSLRFPQRVQSKEATPKIKRKLLGNGSPSKSPPLPTTQLALSDRPCVVILKKPLEKLLIRYEKLPSDYRIPFILNLESFGHSASMPGSTTMTANRTASSTLASLSRYFYHQRWVWSVQSSLGPSVPITSVAQILSTLTEVRLSEGFHFAATGDGIVTMVIELPIKVGSRDEEIHTCLVQYIIFPPHSTSTKDSFSTDDDNDTEVEAIELDTELNLVTECWVEPQCGHVVTSAESRKHLNGLSYLDIPKAMYPRDHVCISTMLAFEHLNQLCQNKDYILPIWGPRSTEGDYDGDNDFIRMIPFQFDLMKLLPKCQQIELFFHTFSKEDDGSTDETSSLPNEILLNLFHSCLQQDLSDRELSLADSDHLTLMEQIVQRDRDGHPIPFVLPVVKGKKEQSLNGGNCLSETVIPPESESVPQWRCYAKSMNSQQIFLTFLPATFAGLENHSPRPTPLSPTLADSETSLFSLPPKKDFHITFSQRTSQIDPSDVNRLHCPVYVYNCSLDSLREQLVNPCADRPTRDLYFRSLSHERPANSPWIDPISRHHKNKELSNYCSLLQEHYHQCVFRSLQQSYYISSQDLLTAMDYCEESLQEIDITNFLQTLCGHIRSFRESHDLQLWNDHESNPTTFVIRGADRENERVQRGILASTSSIETEDFGEHDLKSVASPVIQEEVKVKKNYPEFHLSLLQSSQQCEDKFLEICRQYFKTVPSNPYYFFYCPTSAKKEVKEGERKRNEDNDLSELEVTGEEGNTSGCCVVTESDPDLEVEYREKLSDKDCLDADSLSDTNTVNRDDDSFSVLGGDSLNEQDFADQEMPPLFIHLTCSLSGKKPHGSLPVESIPVESLPTCLGEIIGCLQNYPVRSVDLNDLVITLDIFVLTLPLEIEDMTSQITHHRYTSDSSTSMNRSPGQPSSYRSDDDIMQNLDPLSDPLSKLPTLHKQAVLATMDEIHWLLEDEIVSALRHSTNITLATLTKISDHVYRSKGRPRCHSEVVPLQFVFGPDQSLEKFKEVRNIDLSSNECSFKYRPSRVQSVVSSQGSLDSDLLGYDGGSSDSECEGATMNEQDPKCPLMPEFWLIIKIHQDRVEIYSHTRSNEFVAEEEEEPEYLCLYRTVIKKIGEICRVVNQRLLLQDLHDSHVCNSLLVAESEEDIWKNETPYTSYRQRTITNDDYSADDSYQPRDYLAATMQFIPGHFACEVVWKTIIHIHPRLKMGPNMGVSRAIQALRSVLNAFSVVNRKNMFVYQERATKSVFYLRLSETTCTGNTADMDREGQPMLSSRSLALTRSQEPIFVDELGVRAYPLSSRNTESSRPVGQVDKHILLMVHGVGQAGPEITDELVKVLRRRLDEATLDIITVMLVRNCKLTPADVEFIQPPGMPPTEVVQFTIPHCCLPWLHAVAYYLRQNLLIFLHTPKYTDSNVEHHFQHYTRGKNVSDADIYLYNKPGGQGTGGKGNAKLVFVCVCALSKYMYFSVGESFIVLTSTDTNTLVRFDIWEQGNISLLQLTDKLRNALRHALCDAVMEFRVLQCPLCVESYCPVMLASETDFSSGKTSTTSNPDSTTPTSKTSRRSFWDLLSKTDFSDIASPKTTDDIVLEKSDDSRIRRRHKTEHLKQPSSAERVSATELERRTGQLEEGDLGSLHQLFHGTCQQWMAFMDRLGCPSVQQCSVDIGSRFLLSSILTEIENLVSSLAIDTMVKIFEKIRLVGVPFSPHGPTFLPYLLSQHSSTRPGSARQFILIGRNFHQWRYSTEQGFFFCFHCRFIYGVFIFQLTLYTYNWSVDLGASLNRGLTRLIQWQNARSHVVHCLLSQKMGLFHHYLFADTPVYDDSKQEPNPFLHSTLDADSLIKSPTPPPNKEQARLSSSNRSLPPLHFPPEIVPFDEALRDITVPKSMRQSHDVGLSDPVSRHGTQFLEIKNLERREMEKQMKIENLFVTWQQRSAQSNMPITTGDLDTLKQSSRLVHYCATPLLFDPIFRQQIQAEQQVGSEGKVTSGRDRSHSCDSVETMPSKLKEEQWLGEISNAFMQQYIQYLQSMGFILVQVRPPSPTRSLARTRPVGSQTTDTRPMTSISKQKSDDSPKSMESSSVMTYHLQRALPGGIVLMELAFQGCYFCVKQYALECSRIPMGQSVNSQLSMLFTEECDKVRDLMHVHSFSYDFHLRIIHQYLVGRQMTLRQGYHLTSFLEDFICHHPDIPKYGRNHIFEGNICLSTNMTTAHQLYNYITDHASIYGMKPLRMSRMTVKFNLISLCFVLRSGSYKDSEGIRHHDEFDVSLLVCHSAGPFEEQPETEHNMLRLRFYVIMTSCRELFPRLTADMRRFKKPPRTHGWDEASDSSEFYSHGKQFKMAPELFYSSPLFPLLSSEVATAQEQIATMVQQAKSHCRRDVLWQRLFLGEHLSSDKYKMSKLTFTELEELLSAVHSKSISEIDPQLDCFLSMSTSWYQSLIKVLLNRFSQSCRHFVDADRGIQYLAVLNQKFIDCFVLIFLNSQSGKTNLKVVFREPLPAQPQNSDSPLPQLVSMYYHLESVINTACFNLWTGLL
uniref:SZT2 subunit of KICSTOR complex n=1 Tax=Callorhinchus milii TaxID=7868 RepID=A0A4W3GX49_CALMI